MRYLKPDMCIRWIWCLLHKGSVFLIRRRFLRYAWPLVIWACWQGWSRKSAWPYRIPYKYHWRHSTYSWSLQSSILFYSTTPASVLIFLAIYYKNNNDKLWFKSTIVLSIRYFRLLKGKHVVQKCILEVLKAKYLKELF